MRRWRRRIVGASLLLLMALAVLALGSLLSYRGLDWADKFGSAASVVIGVVALLYPVLSYVSGWFTESPPASVTPMAQAQDELAAVLARRWSEEDRWHRIHDPRPLPVRYRLGHSRITGDYNDIAEVFRGLAEHRLVILGTAGAGKSVLVVRLARELLATRQPTEPVPLILSAATWRPEINITDWIEYELERSYPSLASPVQSAEGTTTLARMLADSGVLPIVDALDELPEPLRVRAIADLSAYGSDRPLVLTSRPDEYQKATATFGRPLPLTETATVSPLQLEEAQRYLAESTPHNAKWDEVFAALRRDPGGPLAQALTNPLLLRLARAIYERRNTDPADLLRHSTSEEDIQSHLLGHFVPAVYGDQPGRRTTWQPSQAQRWLRNLAEEVRWHHYGEFSQRIVWWRLAPTAGPISQLIPAVVVTGLLWWLTDSYRKHPDGFIRTIRSIMERGPLGRVVSPWTEELFLGVERIFPGTGELLMRALPNSWLSCVVWFLALHVVLGRIGFGGDRSTPLWCCVLDIRLEIIPLLTRLCLAAAVTGLLLPAALASSDIPVSAGHVGLTAAGVVLWSLAHKARCLCSDISGVEVASPQASLRADRIAGIVVTAVQAVALSGLTTLLVGIDLGIAFLVAAAVVITLRHTLGSNRRGRFASEGYARARLVRWLRRQAPWRLMAFLADAQQRGVLRQDGAGYRFRHLRLLEHLAGPEEEDGFLVGMLIRYGVPLYQRASRIGTRIIEWTESRLQRDAGSDLEVVRDGLASTYRDPRIDRWPRTRRLSEADMPRARRSLTVVFDGTGHVLGQRPSGWRVAVAAAMLPLVGRQRARRHLARHAGPLLPSADVIRDMSNRDLRIVELIRSSRSLVVPTTIQPGETMVREVHQHPYGMSSVVARLSLAIVAGVVFTVWAGNGMNLFEFAGLLASVWGVAWAIWNLIHHHSARLLITSRRIVIVSGLVTHDSAEHPLTAVAELTCTRTLAGAIWDFGRIDLTTDPDAMLTSYQTSPLGRLLGYGTLLFGEGDPYAPLAVIDWIPQPLSTYRLLVGLADAVRENRADLSTAHAGPST